LVVVFVDEGTNDMKWAELADEDTVKRTSEALRARGVRVEFLQTREEALKRIVELIPPGAEVMTGSSTTLKEIGFVDLLKGGNHLWNNLKDAIFKEKDPLKQMELRKRSVSAEYFLGSVHAVTQLGEVIIASNTGSQLPSYAYSSNNVVWVVGAQKIVLNLEEGMRRVKEYCLPLEDKRMKQTGFTGSAIGKILIFEREAMPNRKITLIFVNEKLGF
jgi:L-lactate utilization protein LutC